MISGLVLAMGLYLGFSQPAVSADYYLNTEQHTYVTAVRMTKLQKQVTPVFVMTKEQVKQISEALNKKEEASAEQKAEPVRKDFSVHFDFDSHRLRPDAIEVLKQIPAEGTVSITGHASPEGSDRYNLKLSRKRALSVWKYLKEHTRLTVRELSHRGERDCKLPREEWPECRRVDISLE